MAPNQTDCSAITSVMMGIAPADQSVEHEKTVSKRRMADSSIWQVSVALRRYTWYDSPFPCTIVHQLRDR